MIENVEFREDPRYGYAVARVRAMESRMLDEYFFNRLATENAEGALRMLGDSVYRDFFNDPDDMENFGVALEKHLEWVFDEIENMAEEPEMIRVLRLRYDYHNLGPAFMAFVKKEALDKSQLSALGNIKIEHLEAAVQKQDDAFFQESFGDAWGESFKAWEESPEPAAREKLVSVWDNAYWTRVLQESRMVKNDFLRTYCNLLFEWENLERLVRQKVLFRDEVSVRLDLVDESDWGEDVWRRLGLTPLEQLADAVPMSVLKGPFAEAVNAAIQEDRLNGFLEARTRWQEDFLEPAKYVVHGVEPLVAFFVRKEIETDRLRYILARITHPVTEPVEASK